MDKRELRLRLIVELDMIKTMLAFYVNDQDATDLLLDRMNEIKRFIAEIDKELTNDKN
jgi:hypothetical protein